jgi:hypothetical protein
MKLKLCEWLPAGGSVFCGESDIQAERIFTMKF